MIVIYGQVLSTRFVAAVLRQNKAWNRIVIIGVALHTGRHRAEIVPRSHCAIVPSLIVRARPLVSCHAGDRSGRTLRESISYFGCDGLQFALCAPCVGSLSEPMHNLFLSRRRRISSAIPATRNRQRTGQKGRTPKAFKSTRHGGQLSAFFATLLVSNEIVCYERSQCIAIRSAQTGWAHKNTNPELLLTKCPFTIMSVTSTYLHYITSPSTIHVLSYGSLCGMTLWY